MPPALKRAFLAALFMAVHVILAILFIWAIWLLQMELIMAGEPRLFDLMPLRYVFDAIDLGICMAFVAFATLEVCILYQEVYRPALLGETTGGTDE